jgi:hypothetical protein
LHSIDKKNHPFIKKALDQRECLRYTVPSINKRQFWLTIAIEEQNYQKADYVLVEFDEQWSKVQVLERHSIDGAHLHKLKSKDIEYSSGPLLQLRRNLFALVSMASAAPQSAHKSKVFLFLLEFTKQN